MDKAKQILSMLVKKSYWISNIQAKKIKIEARQKGVTESLLMRLIITKWFEK